MLLTTVSRPRHLHASGIVVLAASVLLALALLPALPRTVLAADPAPVPAADPEQDVLGMSLEDAMNVKLTTASKKEWPWFRTAAAVYVITAEDMRRSGSRNIAEALRLVPGVEVARIDGSKWAVTARGFNGRFANKLLVLVDGFSVYHPIFGGVYWDALQIAPAEIERIEVIRGPGATLWGANAVNGVINIITKDSGDTRRLLVDSRSGTLDQGFGAAQVGGAMGTNATFRVFGQGLTQEGFSTLLPSNESSNWRSMRGGFRTDWNPRAADHMVVTGEAHRDHERQLLTMASLTAPYSTTLWDDAVVEGANVSARWTHATSAASDVSARATVDHFQRQEYLGTMKSNTLDLDFQHRFASGRTHETVWGLNYRLIGMNLRAIGPLSFPDPERLDYQTGGFLQHNVFTRDQRGTLSLGTKVEQSSTSELSLQPSLNLSFQPTPRQTMWGSVSHARRTYIVGEEDARVQVIAFPDPTGSGLTVVPTMVPQPDGEDERVLAYEAGYRIRPIERATIDVAAYWNEYSHLRTLELGPQGLEFAGGVPYVIMPLIQTGGGAGTGRGIEAMLWVQPASRWQLRGVYSYSRLKLRQSGGGGATPTVANASQPPLHSGYLQSLFDVHRNVEFDTWLRMVDRLPKAGVPAYMELDARLGWRMHPSFEIAVEGNNLLHDRHMEFIKDFVYEPSWVERGVQVMLRYRG
jgi:iron complex outermembrane recepter protein